MARSSRIPRTEEELLRALDDHQFLLRQSLHGLAQDPSFIKTLASELRTLICESSGTEGLLWRVADLLNVSDVVELQAAQSVNRDHPLNQGLAIDKLTFRRPGQGPPAQPPVQIRLRDAIKQCEAIYVAQIKDEVFTHERLIGAIAGQMGGAHEESALDHKLVLLNNLLINHRQLYFQVLAFDAELALEIGERVLDHAEQYRGYRRASRPVGYGDSSFVFRVARQNVILGEIPVVVFHSPTADATITFCLRARLAVFHLVKRGMTVAEIEAPNPPDWQDDADVLFALSYSSGYRQVRTISNGQANGQPIDCDLGWLDGREMAQPDLNPASGDFVTVRRVRLYERLLSPSECGQLLRLSPDYRELRRHGAPPEGPFPS